MSLNKSYREPVYLISEVAEILDIHPQTLRQYEREGFVVPSRTNGRIRLYSQENIDYIKDILYLTRQKGINLAGVSMILEQQKQIKDLQIIIDEFTAEQSTTVTISKALVIKETQYDLVVIKD